MYKNGIKIQQECEISVFNVLFFIKVVKYLLVHLYSIYFFIFVRAWPVKNLKTLFNI